MTTTSSTSSLITSQLTWENLEDTGSGSYSWLSNHLNIGLVGETLYIGYQGHVSGVQGVVVRRLNGANWEMLPSPNDITNYANINYVEFKVIDGVPYIGYLEYELSDNQLNGSLLKWENEQWVPVGALNFFTTRAGWFKFDVHNGTPYVAFTDTEQNWKCSAMTFNGTEWTHLGAPNISEAAIAGTSLDIAVDNTGVPYVVYREESGTQQGVCKKWDGTEWVPVGTNGNAFSVAEIDYPNIEFSSDNTPYIFYGDFGYGGSGGVSRTQKASVSTFDGTAWVPLGVHPIDQRIESARLCIHNNKPVIMYKKAEPVGTLYKPIVVKEWNGTEWIQIGETNVGTNSTLPLIHASNLTVSANRDYYALLCSYGPTGLQLEVTKCTPAPDVVPVENQKITFFQNNSEPLA